MSALAQSLLLALGALGVATVLGLGSALVWSACPPGIARLGRLLAGITLVQPPFLAANAWLDLTGDLRSSGNTPSGAAWGLGLTILVLGLTLWPIPALAVHAAWSRMPVGWLEAEPRSAGLGLFRRHLWPAARPSLGPALGLVGILAITQFSLPVLFQVKVLPEVVWLSLNTRLDTWGAVTASLPMALVPILVWRWIGKGPVQWIPGTATGEAADRLRDRLRGSAFVLALPWALMAVGLGLGLPWGRLILEPRTWSELPGALAAGGSATANSLLGALLGAGAATGAGLLAVFLQGSRARGPGLLWILFLVPGVVLSVGWIALLRLPGLGVLASSPLLFAMALGLRHLAPAWAAVAAAARTADPDLVHAAQLDGNRFHAFRTGLWPQIRGKVFATAGIVYLLALWDVESVLLVAPPGGETLAMRIFNLLHYGHATQVNALCVVLAVLGAVPWILGPPLLRWLTPKRSESEEGGQR